MSDQNDQNDQNEQIKVTLRLTHRQLEIIKATARVYMMNGGPMVECAPEWDDDAVSQGAPYTCEEVEAAGAILARASVEGAQVSLTFRPTADAHSRDVYRDSAIIGFLQWHAGRPPRFKLWGGNDVTVEEMRQIVAKYDEVAVAAARGGTR